MRRLRFLTGTGDGVAIVPGGQILTISMVPGPEGSWIQINESKAIWVPGAAVFSLEALDVGYEPGETQRCDQYPGDVQIAITFGTGVQIPPDESIGDPPATWLVVYNDDPYPSKRC